MLEQDFGFRKDGFVLVGYDGPEPDDAGARRRSTSVLDSRFPEAEAQTNSEFIDSQAEQIDQVLFLIYALLALAIIVSLFGIVNTLVLSIAERTREIGAAAGDRHVAPSGPADDPLRGGHHRA